MSELYEAILAVQKDAPTLPKDKTAKVQTKSGGEYSYSYTDLATIVEKIGPLLVTHGLVWFTLPSGTHDEPTLKYRLTYAATGEAIDGEMPLLFDVESARMSAAQVMGSAITYMRRYSLCAVLNLVADDDDDGQAAGTRAKKGVGRPGRPSDPQRDLIPKLITKKRVSKEQLRIILDTIGAKIEITDGWVDRLTPGRDGTASALITFLQENPLPSVEHPSDIPEPAEGEFEHPAEPPMELIG